MFERTTRAKGSVEQFKERGEHWGRWEEGPQPKDARSERRDERFQGAKLEGAKFNVRSVTPMKGYSPSVWT